jgi:hypothetical protein
MMQTDEVNGVPLNPIHYERTSLTFDEAVAAWVMRRGGMKFNLIAARLGTNPLRLSEVFNREKHPEAYEIASRVA